MKKIFQVFVLSAVIYLPSVFALSTVSPGLPPVEEVFTVGMYSTPKSMKPYFTKESLMKVYPRLGPAVVKIPSGAKRYWQSGVIVTTDKKVIFWTTCADSFIRVLPEEGEPMDFATSKVVEVK
jgi:hypothetical protein